MGTVTSQQAHIARQIEAPDEAQFEAELAHAASTNGVNNSLSFRFRDPASRTPHPPGADRRDRPPGVDTLFTDSYPLATGILATTALGYVDTSENYVHDLEQAASLLDEAGWEAGPDGTRSKDGEALTLTFNEALPQPRSREVVTLIQEQLAELGIAVELLPGDQAAQDAARAEPGTLQVYHSMVGRADHDVLKSQLSSDNRNALLNGHPDGSVGDEELDELLAQIASTPQEEGRAEASAAAQAHVAEQAYVPLFEEPQVSGVEMVQGLPPSRWAAPPSTTPGSRAEGPPMRYPCAGSAARLLVLAFTAAPVLLCGPARRRGPRPLRQPRPGPDRRSAGRDPCRLRRGPFRDRAVLTPPSPSCAATWATLSRAVRRSPPCSPRRCPPR